MLREKLMAMPGRVRIDYRGCGEQQMAHARRFAERNGVRIVETRMAGTYSNCTVEIEVLETGERTGYHQPFELYVYPQQQLA